MLQTVPSLFGGSHLHHLSSIDEKTRLLYHFEKVSHINPLKSTLSKTHVLDHHNKQLLKEHTYFALASPNDVSFYLFLTYFEERNYIFLIGKNIQPGFSQPKCILLDAQCSEDCFDNTIIDVTRVFVNKGRFFFLMTDCIMYKGKSVQKLNYIERLSHLGQFLTHDYTENLKRQPFKLQIVRPFVDLNLLVRTLKKLPYTVNRIVFHPLEPNQKELFYNI